ncbi:hypothetical protein BV25DRAFT_1842774 [Artomyces pyxidatus]|uniref:Uncharacterized protein n=1 Tax=Artomyces pyxidatus TaxID=48021 RepID=A0ACB8SH20_9AGAM|nr:hypothetical protein BV25DRAFT_1842774 [Artomyces pyxidatus]
MSSESSDAPMTIGGLSTPGTTMDETAECLPPTPAPSPDILASDVDPFTAEFQASFRPRQGYATSDLDVFFCKLLHAHMMLIRLMHRTWRRKRLTKPWNSWHRRDESFSLSVMRAGKREAVPMNCVLCKVNLLATIVAADSGVEGSFSASSELRPHSRRFGSIRSRHPNLWRKTHAVEGKGIEF